MLSVDVAYAEWGSRNRAASLGETLRCIATAGGRVNRIVIVDNKLECARYDAEYAGVASVLPGNNLAREFSAWDLAVRELGTGVQAGVLLCVNDTFAAHRRIRIARRWRIARWMQIVARSAEPELFGQLDPFEAGPVEWPFGTFSTYISSYFFGLNFMAARRLFPLTKIDSQLDRLLNAEFSPAGLFAEALPSAYRRAVEHWLFTPDQWRNAGALTAENFSFLRLKAKSILYEHAMTCQAYSGGIRVSDFYAGRGRLDECTAHLAKVWVTRTSLLRQSLLAALTASPDDHGVRP